MNGRVIAILTSYLVSLRQLGNGKSMSRTEFARLMLPHEVKDNQLLSIEGKKLYAWEGEDQEVIPANLFGQKVATDAWLNKIVTALNSNLLGTASEQAEAEAEDVDEPEVEDEPVIETEVVEEPEEVKKIRKLLAKGKIKKAKKLLKEAKDLLSKDTFKTLKKELNNE